MQGKTNGHDFEGAQFTSPRLAAAEDGLELLLTVNELAELWKVEVGQIRRLTRTGNLPFVRIGRYIRFHERDVQVWLEAQKNVSSRKR